MTKVTVSAPIAVEIEVGREKGIGTSDFWIREGSNRITFDRETAYEIVNALRFLAAPYKNWEME